MKPSPPQPRSPRSPGRPALTIPAPAYAYAFAAALALALAAAPPARLAAQDAGNVSFPPVKVTWAFEARHAACPEKPVFTGSVSFPRETGGAATDAEIARLAEGWLAEARAKASADMARTASPCAAEEGKGLFFEIGYELFRPSPALLGILFTDRGYDGGPRSWLGYNAYTFELATGRLLGPADLFPDLGKGYAGLWSFIWGSACLSDPPRGSLPRFYGGLACSGKAPPPPPEGFLADAESLEDLGSLVLTEKGASVNIDPSSAWTWTEGPYTLQVPKSDLIGMGADPAFWSR